MHNRPNDVSLTQNITPWGPVLLKGLGWELLFILLCLRRASGFWLGQGGCGGIGQCSIPISAHRSSGSTAAAHVQGYLVTEALQGYCQRGQVVGAELMVQVQAPIHY